MDVGKVPKTKKKRVKTCFVLSCSSSESAGCKKIFFTVPLDAEKRRQWAAAAGHSQLLKGPHFCCEDHFNLSEDLENYYYYKMMGKNAKFKQNVVPHLNLTPSSNTSGTKTQISSSDRKRNLSSLIRLQSKQSGAKRVLFARDEAEASTSREDSFKHPDQLSSHPSGSSGNTEDRTMDVVGMESAPTALLVPPQTPRKIWSSRTTYVQPSPSGSSVGAKISPWSCTDYEPPSSISESDGSLVGWKRIPRYESTLYVIEQSCKFYLGMPKEVYCIVKSLTVHTGLSQRSNATFC